MPKKNPAAATSGDGGWESWLLFTRVGEKHFAPRGIDNSDTVAVNSGSTTTGAESTETEQRKRARCRNVVVEVRVDVVVVRTCT